MRRQLDALSEWNDSPDIWIDHDSNPWIVWISTTGKKDYIALKKANEATKKESLAPKPGYYSGPAIAGDKKGDIVVAYSEVTSGKLLANIFDGKRWKGETVLHQTGKNLNPTMAADKNGNVWIAWEHHSLGNHEILVGEMKEASLSHVTNITSGLGRSYHPAIKVGSDGVVWVAFDSFFRDHYAVFLMSLQNCLPTNIIKVSKTYCQNRFPRIDLDRDNNIWISWTSNSLLEKDYVSPSVPHVRYPTWGHGWRIHKKIHLKKYVDGKLYTTISSKPQGNNKSQDGEISFPSHSLPEHSLVKIIKKSPILLFRMYEAESSRFPIYISQYEDEAWSKPVLVSDKLCISSGQIKSESDQKSQIWTVWKSSNTQIKSRFNSRRYEWCKNASSIFTNNLYMSLLKSEHKLARPEKAVQFCRGRADNVIKSSPRFRIEYGGERLYLFWGDLHMHSDVSVCSRHPESNCGDLDDKYFYARDLANLDFAMIADHDCQMSNFQWHKTTKAAERDTIEGDFIAFPGYEWSSKPRIANYGHRNVVFDQSFPPIFRSEEPDSDTPTALWECLKGKRAITIPHLHNPFDWAYHDPALQPLVEIFQVRGSHESRGCLLNPANYGRKVEGLSYVADALHRGYHLGFVGGGEHEGVGMMGVYARELTRKALFEAFKKKHTYATTNAQISLDFRVCDCLMGESIAVEMGPRICLRTIGEEGKRLIKVEIIRDGKMLYEQDAGRKKSLVVQYIDDGITVGNHYYYARVLQEDDDMAWSSPVYVSML